MRVNQTCLNIARFNPSRRSNADHFWNDDTTTSESSEENQEMRGDHVVKDKSRQAAILKENFNFDCNCEACDSIQAHIFKTKPKAQNCTEKKRGDKRSFMRTLSQTWPVINRPGVAGAVQRCSINSFVTDSLISSLFK